MRRRRAALLLAGLSFVIVAGCRSVPPPTPLNQLNSVQAQGYDVFETRCAMCHNERIDEAKHGPALVGVFKKPSLPSGAPANDERVTNTILHGHGLMPAITNLDQNELDELLAYLHTV